jgi:general secretion pathway protein H
VIIGTILATIAPKLVDRKMRMRESVRKLASLTREVHNASRLYNATYRLVITMDDKKGHSYTVESAPGNVTLLTEDQAEEEAKASSGKSDEDLPKSEFSEDARVLKRPEELPKGFYVGSVEYGNRTDAINDGVAYIHFFPQGLTEEAVIHLTDKKSLHWTIALHPITGRANLYERNISLRELREQ